MAFSLNNKCLLYANEVTYFAAKVTSGTCGLCNYPFPKHYYYFRGTENTEFIWAVTCSSTHPVTPLELLGAHAGAGASSNQYTEFIFFSILPPLLRWGFALLQGSHRWRVLLQLPCCLPPSVGPAFHQPQPVWSPALARPLPSSW